MGEVRRPEDVIHRKHKPSPDLTPHPIPRPITPRNLEDVMAELRSLRAEIAKIKQALRTHSIPIKWAVCPIHSSSKR